MPSPSIFVFFKDKPKIIETIMLTLYRRLGHAEPQIFKHISTNYNITVKESGPTTKKYKTYGLLKIY